MAILRKRIVKACDKPIEERTIPEIIETVPHVNPMNSDSIITEYNQRRIAEKFPKYFKGELSYEEKYWMNPNNQTSFEHGYLTHQDFIDWANGTGVVVRGETQEQKDKFMRYDEAHSKLDLSIFIYAKYLHLIDSDSETSIQWGIHTRTKNPINTSRKQDSNTVIKKMLETRVQPVLNDIRDKHRWYGNNKEENDWLNKVHRETNDYMYAFVHAIALTGHGYFGASNTPTVLENLAWSKDLVFAKAYSIFVEEQDPGIIECIRWCDENRYKIKAV